MPVVVHIPAPLRLFTDGRAEVQARARDLRSLIEELEADHPGLRRRLCEHNGELRPFVSVFVNKEDVRFLSGLDTPLADGDEVVIITALAGG